MNTIKFDSTSTLLPLIRERQDDEYNSDENIIKKEELKNLFVNSNNDIKSVRSKKVSFTNFNKIRYTNNNNSRKSSGMISGKLNTIKIIY